MKQLHRYCLAVTWALVFAGSPAAASPVGPWFTYQGALQESGSPASGSYDFEFRLFDASVAGAQIGNTYIIDDLTVSQGVFTVELNFGPSVFGPDARWLQISVRPGLNTGPYTILTPRQSITAAPVSLYSLDAADGNWNAAGAGITNANAGGFVGVNRSNRVTGAEYFGIQAPVSAGGYGGMYIGTDAATAKPFYGYSTGTQTAWSYLDGATGKWHLANDGDRLTVTDQGDVGVGTTSPSARLDAITSAPDGIAIKGVATNQSSVGVSGVGGHVGVAGECASPGWYGVFGRSTGAGGAGVIGDGVGATSAGVYGYCSEGNGVSGFTTFGMGVYGSNHGSNTVGHAAYFNGRVHVAGNLSKASGSFKIDHPLDPLNKTLSHSFVESPDMMNIYNGNVTTDGDGRAVVELPSYFDALNRDFRYQLTVLGTFAQTMIEQEVKDNRFVIRTDRPGVRVSWQVTGIRDDAWAQTNPIVVEEEKPMADRGHYLHPGAYPTVEWQGPEAPQTATTAALAVIAPDPLAVIAPVPTEGVR